MALSAQALTTWETIKDEVRSISKDLTKDRSERVINAISAAMAKVAGRTFQYEAGLIENLPGFGGPDLILGRAPVISVTSIELLAVDLVVEYTFASDSYQIKASTGILHRPSGWPSTAQVGPSLDGTRLADTERPAIKVTYAGGYVTPQQQVDNPGVLTRDLPYDLEEACIDSVLAKLARSPKRDMDIISKSTQEVSTQWRDRSTIPTGLLLKSTEAVAKSYWRGAI
jgi:hypothetical protein